MEEETAGSECAGSLSASGTDFVILDSSTALVVVDQSGKVLDDSGVLSRFRIYLLEHSSVRTILKPVLTGTTVAALLPAAASSPTFAALAHQVVSIAGLTLSPVIVTIVQSIISGASLGIISAGVWKGYARLLGDDNRFTAYAHEVLTPESELYAPALRCLQAFANEAGWQLQGDNHDLIPCGELCVRANVAKSVFSGPLKLRLGYLHGSISLLCKDRDQLVKRMMELKQCASEEEIKTAFTFRRWGDYRAFVALALTQQDTSVYEEK